MKKYGLNISTKIVLSLVFIMLAGMFMVAIAVLKMAERDIIRQKINSATILSHALAQAINDLSTDSKLETENWRKDIQSLLHTSIGPSGFDYIALVNSDREIIAQSGVEDIKWAPFLAEAKSMASAMESTFSLTGTEVFGLFRKNLRLSAVVPLFKNGQKWSVIYAQNLLTNLREDMTQLCWLTFLYLILDALLLFIFGYLLISKSVVQPVRRLTSVVEATSDLDLGTFTSYEPQNENEIGKLYRAFEHMGKRLRKQRIKIEDYIESLKKTNRELKKAQEEIIRSEKLASVGRLASGVAHEIGNPLAAIIGYVELLLQGTVNKEEQIDFLNRISSELQRINTIIRDLLDFSRPASCQIEGVHVNDVIESSLSLLSHQEARQHIQIKTDLQPDLPLVRANNQQLKQVLINILVNASDALPAGGDIQIRSKLKKIADDDEDKYIVIEIEDNGTGIKPEDLSKIFDPFFTTKAPGKGTGLGLAVSLSLMESFGGKITVESMVGQGTKFGLILKKW